MQQSLKKAFAAYRIRIFSFSKCFKFFYLESNANNKHVISIYLNCTNCHYYCLYLVYALLESPNEKPRVPDESILHILHSVDVHAGHSSFSGTLGVSAKSMVVPRRTAGPEAPSRVTSFVLFFARRLWLRLRRCSVRPVCGAEQTESGTFSDPRVPCALLSFLICDSTHLWPTRMFAALSIIVTIRFFF